MKYSDKKLAQLIKDGQEKEKVLWYLYVHRFSTPSKLKSIAKEQHFIDELTQSDIIQWHNHGRQSFYTLKDDATKSTLENIWSSLHLDNRKVPVKRKQPQGINYCRSCYDHLAGYLGVSMTDALEKNNYLTKSSTDYTVTEKGWKWLENLGIRKEDLTKSHIALTRACLDNTEKRHHLAGQLGAALLCKMVEKSWLRRKGKTRVLEPTESGKVAFFRPLGIDI